MWTDKNGKPLTLTLKTPIEKYDYGPVLILRGRFAGRLGLYDDEDSKDQKGMVYTDPAGGGGTTLFENPIDFMDSRFYFVPLPLAYLAKIVAVAEPEEVP